MKSDEEILQAIEAIAASDERIRALALEGSRVNPNAVKDAYQDFDITFLVTNVNSFTSDDTWLNQFGTIVFMQKPEAMELFSAACDEVCETLGFANPHHGAAIKAYHDALSGQ